jgi:mono/diheme cytochrome c family protein
MNERSPITRRIPLLSLASIALAACAGAAENLPPPPPPVAKAQEIAQGVGERGGMVLAKDAYGDGATKIVYLDQGWGPLETLWYYHADQGSVMMPYEVLVNLEQTANQERFIAPEHLSRFRFLLQHQTPNNPDALPVGFARHGDRVGLTCAACHTTQLNYHGTAVRIDGGQAMADVIGFMAEVRLAIAATLGDEAKLARYVARTKGNKDAAKAALTESLKWFESYETANHPSVKEGFARLDAITRIVNQAIRFTSDPRNSVTPSAPASFPVLWDAPRHDYVQWTGFAPNAEAGSIGRNVGEVLGVYGHIEVKHYETEAEAKKGYRSTAEANEMVSMEEALRKLQSPRWPEDVLPPIDKALAARGEALYRSECVSCHALLDRADPHRKVTAMMTDVEVVGTDPTAAKLVTSARVPSGILQGAISPKGDKYGADMPALAMLGDLVARSLAQKPDAAVKALASAKIHGLEKTAKQGNHKQPTDQDPVADLRAYKARPLNGVWASAPYLHNGSVPSLYDLLLPPASRPARFAVGRWEYDPKKVGYVSDGNIPFVLDTTLPGNRNQGHEYGTKLSEADRWALVEYLKTL